MWKRKTTGIETAIKDCPTKLVFRDAVLETTMESFASGSNRRDERTLFAERMGLQSENLKN